MHNKNSTDEEKKESLCLTEVDIDVLTILRLYFKNFIQTKKINSESKMTCTELRL